MKTTINDFGKKIGGARKDWHASGLSFSDTLDMTDQEKLKYVKRDEIWPKPDWETLVAEGLDPAVGYYINEVRTSLCPKPSTLDGIEDYINTIRSIRDEATKLRTSSQIEEFPVQFIFPKFTIIAGYHSVRIKENARSVITSKTIKTVQMSYRKCSLESKKKLFAVPKGRKEYTKAKNSMTILQYDGDKLRKEKDYRGRPVLCFKVGFSSWFYYPKEDVEYAIGSYLVLSNRGEVIRWNVSKEDAEAFVEGLANLAQAAADSSGAKEKKTRKSKFKIDDPGKMERYGGKTMDRDMTGDDYLETFKFAGGEFGNWVNQAERQDSLNSGYYALLDLADVLGIKPENISLGGQLSIAFGARGHGRASAHYEPLRQVISLTKPRGAGCLAHEWGHALDDYLGRVNGLPVGELASQKSHKLPKAFADLISLMNMQDGKMTEYYKGSRAFGRMFSRNDGYWESDEEMFARAFDCYVTDKLRERGWRSDYLTNRADSYHVEVDGAEVYAVPMGEERERINAAFDGLFDHLRQGILA